MAQEWMTSVEVVCTRIVVSDRHDHGIVDGQQPELAGLQILVLHQIGVEGEVAVCRDIRRTSTTDGRSP